MKTGSPAPISTEHPPSPNRIASKRIKIKMSYPNKNCTGGHATRQRLYFSKPPHEYNGIESSGNTSFGGSHGSKQTGFTVFE
jgi:hypothetical protein